MIKRAAVSYGILDKSSLRPEPPSKVKPPTDPAKFALEDKLADKANLPRGTMVTADQFGKINLNIISHERAVALRQAEQRQAAEAEAAAAAAAAEVPGETK